MFGNWCFAGALPEGVLIEVIDNPSGGLRTDMPSHKISAKYSPYMRNVFVDHGKIQGVNGYETLGSSDALDKVTGIFPFNRENGNLTFLVTDSSVTLETADFTAWTFVSSGSNTGATLNWMQVRNKMWGFNGVDVVKTWDGTVQQILDGTKGLPNVPKFKYGQYWQDRVWGFNISGRVSDLDFSAITTTAAQIIAPDDSRAWPTTNNLKIGQGDGEIGTGMWIDGGQLRLAKERSNHTVYGTSVSNYFARKERSNINGIVSNDSIVNQDDHVYSLRLDGIYEDETRISDLIEPDIEKIDKGVQKTVVDLWETQPDFDRGTFYGSQSNPDGTLSMASGWIGTLTVPAPPTGTSNQDGRFILTSGTLDGDNEPGILTIGSTFYGEHKLKFNSGNGMENRRKLWVKVVNLSAALDAGAQAACGVTFASLTIINGVNGENYKADGTYHVGISRWRFVYTSNTILDGFDILNSSLTMKIEGCGWSAGDITVDMPLQFINSTTVQYVSDVATSTTITAWGNFDSVRNTNQGTINYYFRSSTSVINIATKTWAQVVPGQIISEPTINLYKQWAATITALTFSESSQIYQSTPSVENVEISHLEGTGSVNRTFGISWKNRYWLCVTTDSNSGTKLIYVKSLITNENPNAWMPIEGINILSFARTPTTLYGGSASSGTVYRLDYGTNFDGRPIPFYYDAPDLVFGNNYFRKSRYGYLLDADRDSGLMLNVDSSIDFGVFTNRTVTLDGSGRELNYIKGLTDSFNTLRVRLWHNQLDKRFSINNLTLLALPTQVLEPR